MENVFWLQISAYRKSYKSQHILISLIEEWREYLDKDLVIGWVLTNWLEASDYIPHNLLTAKVEVNCLGEKALSYIYLPRIYIPKSMCSYKWKKSDFQKIISVIPQGSITGPILFNFSINDLFFFVSSASMYNLGDDNSLSAFAKTVAELKSTL